MQKLFDILPNFLQNILISFFNFLAYRKRYGGSYKNYLNIFKANRLLPLQDLKNLQANRFAEFVSCANSNSVFYKNNYDNTRDDFTLNNIQNLPIINKEVLRINIEEVYTIKKENGIVSKTGGTTGKSLTVLYTHANMQERFAMLDDFRSRFGYELGKKTAWFSGKKLLTFSDVKKNRFWKTDHLYKVRYYSTFHIKEDYLKHYIKNLIEFKPEYMVGFPSTIAEIAKYGLKNNIEFPPNVIKAIFPTAETITEEIRTAIERYFKTKMYNQYASSEGAPFIFECCNNKLHLELQSGVFEVLDQDNNPAQSGKLVVTSFTSEGTPLIRYDIGDSITLADEIETCSCGNNNPLVKEILGRIDDYIFSAENGKINLGNVSNTLKDTKGIIKFQVIQDHLDEITIVLQKDEKLYNSKMEEIFLRNWKDRLGSSIKINLKYVDDIPVETSGKFRIVKNNIKHLIDV